MQKNINIVFSSDNAYAPYIGVTMYNIINFLPQEARVKFLVIDSGISAKNKEKLCLVAGNIKNVSLKIVDVREKYGKEVEKLSPYTHNEHLSSGTYALFFVAELFPEIDKALYMDVYILIKGDLLPLYNTDISENYSAVVKGAFSSSCYGNVRAKTRNGMSFKDYCKKIHSIDEQEYYNAGVQLFNLENMRKDRVKDKLVSALTAFSVEEFKDQIEYHNQDFFNKVFYKKVKFLPLKYNMIRGRRKVLSKITQSKEVKEEVNEALQNPVILHYTGRVKPWKDMFFSKDWWIYAKKTPFYRELQICCVRSILKRFFFVSVPHFFIKVRRKNGKISIRVLRISVYKRSV